MSVVPAYKKVTGEISGTGKNNYTGKEKEKMNRTKLNNDQL